MEMNLVHNGDPIIEIITKIIANHEKLANEVQSFKNDFDSHCLRIIDMRNILDDIVKSMPKDTPLSNKKIREEIQMLNDLYVKSIDIVSTGLEKLEENLFQAVAKTDEDLNLMDDRMKRIESFMKEERFLHILEKLDALEKEFKEKALQIVQESLNEDKN